MSHISYSSRIFNYKVSPFKVVSHFNHEFFVPQAFANDNRSYFGNQWVNDDTIIIANGKVYTRDESTGGPYMGPCRGVCKGQVFINGSNLTGDDTGCFGTSGTFHGYVNNGIVYFVNKTDIDLVLTVKKYSTVDGASYCTESTHLVPACGSSNATMPNSHEICYVWEPAQYGTIEKNYNTECLLNGPCQVVSINFTNAAILGTDPFATALRDILFPFNAYSIRYNFNRETGVLSGNYTKTISVPFDDDIWTLFLAIYKDSNGSSINLSINSLVTYNNTQTIFAATYLTNEINSNNPKQDFGGIVQNSVGYANYINNGNFSILANF